LGEYANRKKIAVTTADGITECYVEIDSWDHASKEAFLWTKVPSISSSTDTIIFLYYDSDAADNTTYVGDTTDSAAKNVWDDDYVGVYHMSQDPSGGGDSILDSTSNINHGTPSGMDSGNLVDGETSGKGIDFSGTSEYITIDDHASLQFGTGDYTIEVKAKADVVSYGASSQGTLISKDYTGYESYIYQGVFTSYVAGSTVSGGEIAVSIDIWYLFGFTRTSGTVKNYIDTSAGTSDTQSGDVSKIGTDLIIGTRPLDNLYFNGIIESIRISKMARPEAWLKASYYTIGDNFITYDAPFGVADYSNFLKIEIPTTYIDSTLTDFPVLIHLSSSSGINSDDVTAIFDELGEESKKIKVVLPDETTECYVEVEDWDGIGEEASLWVKVPSLSSVASTVLYLYYDSSAYDNNMYVGDPNSTAAQGVWDDDFVGVYHFTSINTPDSTLNNNDGTVSGAPTIVAGEKGTKAIDLSGTNEYVHMGSGSTLDDISLLTAEAFFNADNFGEASTGRLVDKTTAVNNGWSFCIQVTYGLFFVKDGTGAEGQWGGGGTLTVDGTTWYYGAVTHDDTSINNDPVIFLNATKPSVSEVLTPATAWVSDASANLRVGIRDGGDREFDGKIGEIRISKIIRTDAWLKATYYSLLDQLAEVAIGVFEYDNYYVVTIEKDRIDAALSNYPIMVNLSSTAGINSTDVTPIFDSVGASYQKIAFTKDDGVTRLYAEVEKWDDTAEEASIWVKVPTVSNSVSTQIFLHYGPNSPDDVEYIGLPGSTPAQNVWDSYYEAVFHMAQDPSGGTDAIIDSTSNVNHGTAQGTMLTEDLVDGLFGKALELDGGDDYIQVDDHASLDIATEITLEAFVYPLDVFNKGIMMKGALSSSQGVYSLVVATAGTDWAFRLNGSISEDNGMVSSSLDIGTGAWVYIGGTYDGVDQEIFINETKGKTDPQTGSISTDGNPFNIGVYYTTGFTFEGKISEVRVSAISRTDAWMKATYYMLTDDALSYYLVKGGIPYPKMVVGGKLTTVVDMKTVVGGALRTVEKVQIAHGSKWIDATE
jgi:hypothetical protein